MANRAHLYLPHPRTDGHAVFFPEHCRSNTYSTDSCMHYQQDA